MIQNLANNRKKDWSKKKLGWKTIGNKSMIVLIKKAKDNKIIKKYIQQLRIKKHKRLLQNHQSKSQLERIVIIKKSSHLIK